jgi:acetyltransferase-like isoleucine patch superfamily enzyme
MDIIIRTAEGLSSRLRIAWQKMRGVNIRGHVALRSGVEIPRFPQSITLQDGVALDRGVTLLATDAAARIVIGARVYINRQTMLDAHELIEIGDECMIGPFCYLTDHDHAVSEGVAPSAGPLIAKPTRLGARCWLGAHVAVVKGVTIGEGTVVGAGSVVTKSLPASVVAVGNPARVIRTLGA